VPNITELVDDREACLDLPSGDARLLHYNLILGVDIRSRQSREPQRLSAQI
jgi:hypothetical protein